MATSLQGRVGEQHQAYRKGLVLGLTMAEIAILIIFVLLLLLIFNQLQRADLVERLGGRDPSSLVKRAEAFDRIAVGLGTLPPDTSRDFDKLISAVAEAVRSPGARGTIAGANLALQDIGRARTEIDSVASISKRGGIDSLIRMLEEQSYVIANQQGQIKALQAKLDSLGKGGGE